MRRDHLRSAGLLVSAVFLPLACDGEPPADDPIEISAGGTSGAPVLDEVLAKPQNVTGWIPPYGIRTGLEVLNSSYGGVAVAETIQRLGLQFWTLTAQGEIAYLGGADEGDVSEVLDATRAHGIQVLLTVTNDGASLAQDAAPGFNWRTVRAAFEAVGPEGVADALLDEVELHGLDGVDLDFEAGEDGIARYTDKDRLDYAELVTHLSAGLKPKGRLLTVDTFVTSEGLVPNVSWWGDWVGEVDSLHTMGYQFTYKNGAGEQSYQRLQDEAVSMGYEASQVVLGMPVWLDSWAGNDNNFGYSNRENLEFVAHCLDEPSGVALWALHHPVAHEIPQTGERPWTQSETWKVLGQIREGHAIDSSLCAPQDQNEKVLDRMFTPGTNLLGGRWVAISDFWDRSEEAQALSTRVLTPDRSYDMALGEGSWGQIGEGYRAEDGRLMLSAIVDVLGPVGGAPGFGALWMEFLPRDCERLDDSSDGCGWRPEALSPLDASGSERLVVGLRCDVGQIVQVSIDTTRSAIEYSESFAVDVLCAGEFENVSLEFSEFPELDSSDLARLQIEYRSDKAASAAIDVAGVVLDQDVVD